MSKDLTHMYWKPRMRRRMAKKAFEKITKIFPNLVKCLKIKGW